MVCSDGFWEVFPVDEIHTLFEAADPIRELGTSTEREAGPHGRARQHQRDPRGGPSASGGDMVLGSLSERLL